MKFGMLCVLIGRHICVKNYVSCNINNLMAKLYITVLFKPFVSLLHKYYFTI